MTQTNNVFKGEVGTFAQQETKAQNKNTIGGEPAVHGKLPSAQSESRYERKLTH